MTYNISISFHLSWKPLKRQYFVSNHEGTQTKLAISRSILEGDLGQSFSSFHWTWTIDQRAAVFASLHPSPPPSAHRAATPDCVGARLMSHASISQAKSSRIFIVCQLLPVTDHFGSLATIFIMNIFILACYKYPEHFPQKTSIEDDSEIQIIARFSLYRDTIRIHDTIC